MELEEWLGKDNQLGIDIWNKKYRDGEENFEQWLGRITAGNEEIAQLIREKMGMSKNEFKRAVGHLLKEGKVRITESSIVQL